MGFPQQVHQCFPFPPVDRDRPRQSAHRQPDPQTPETIAEAKAAHERERQAFLVANPDRTLTDDGRIALRIANAIAAAVYGPRGEDR